MPAPVSLPPQETARLPQAPPAAAGGTAAIWLVGVLASIVLSHGAVWMASFWSKTIVAPSLISSPVGRLASGSTVNATPPTPSGGTRFGGRKPSAGSVGGRPVAGSIA